MTDAVDPAATAARRSRLVGIKLRALVTEHTGVEPPAASGFGPGAALAVDRTAWVFVDEQPDRQLGAALAWMLRNDCDRLELVADRGAGVLARRSAHFTTPIQVWSTDDRTLVAAPPTPATASAPAPAHHEDFRGVIVEGGAEPVVEHGVLAGEVCGLEVCRVVDDAAMGVTRLEVGVGAHDREAFQMLHGDTPTAASLARIVDAVRLQREPGASPHPLNRLGAERLIRWRLTQHPELVDATVLAPAPPPVARDNLKDPVPCVATGIGRDGEPVIVVCSSGVDLDLIPYAADARQALGRDPGVGGGRLVLATPSRDRLGVVDELADLLHYSVSFVSVD